MSNQSEENARFVTCPCQHCAGPIEFDGNELNGGNTATAECPHCHLETVIFEAPLAVPPVLPPLPPVAFSPVWFGGKDDLIKIRMTSGECHDIRAVCLY